MIDIESQVFTAVQTAVTAEYPNINMVSQLTFEPTAFPTICLEQMDNFTVERFADSGSADNFETVTFEMTVYTNSESGAKSGAKKIMAVAHDAMTKLGFSCLSCIPLRFNEASKYRLVARYIASVGKDETIYGR